MVQKVELGNSELLQLQPTNETFLTPNFQTFFFFFSIFYLYFIIVTSFLFANLKTHMMEILQFTPSKREKKEKEKKKACSKFSS